MTSFQRHPAHHLLSLHSWLRLHRPSRQYRSSHHRPGPRKAPIPGIHWGWLRSQRKAKHQSQDPSPQPNMSFKGKGVRIQGQVESSAAEGTRRSAYVTIPPLSRVASEWFFRNSRILSEGQALCLRHRAPRLSMFPKGRASRTKRKRNRPPAKKSV